MPGYRARAIGSLSADDLRSLVCPYCRLLLRNAVQTREDGIRLCLSCYMDSSLKWAWLFSLFELIRSKLISHVLVSNASGRLRLSACQLCLYTSATTHVNDAVHFLLYRLSEGCSAPVVPGCKVLSNYSNFYLFIFFTAFHDRFCACTLADFYWSGCAQGNIGGRSALWLLRMDWEGKILTGDVLKAPSLL